MPGTPAPHTPVNFLKGGAAGMFSAACIKAIQKAGLQPEDFGSYDYVGKRLHEKRQKCNLADDYKNGVPKNIPKAEQKARRKRLAEWKKDNPGKAPPQPTEHDRRLAESQAGHLTMNSTYQRERGNPCTSMVDGYEDNLAPCMPHHGSTATAGSEHHWVYHNEYNQPRNHGLSPEGSDLNNCRDPKAGQKPPVPPHKYPADKLDQDESDRIKNNPKLNGEGTSAKKGKGQPASGAGKKGKGAKKAAPKKAGKAGGAGSGKAGKGANKPAWQKEITGNSAAECIDNFRKAAIAAMKQKCVDEIGENKKAASGGTNKTPEEYQADLQKQIDKAKKSGNKKKAKKLESELKQAQYANCRAKMGERLKNGNPHVDGRCPAGSKPKDRGTKTGGGLISPAAYK